MIDFYYWPTPNGWKVAIMLEEAGVEYQTHLVNIGAGEQHTSQFLAINPNGRIPAIVDHTPPSPYPANIDLPVFESGAILWYLAEKAGRFLPDTAVGRKEAMEWVHWQVANLGPMSGQLSHFVNYAEGGDHTYAHQRYLHEVERCLGVLERRLTERAFILGDNYTIADMAAWPWVLVAKPLGVSLQKFPYVAAWRETIKQRPAVQRGVNLAKDSRPSEPLTGDERRVLFGQGDGAGAER